MGSPRRGRLKLIHLQMSWPWGVLAAATQAARRRPPAWRPQAEPARRPHMRPARRPQVAGTAPPRAAPARVAAPGGRRGGPGGARAETPGAAGVEPARRCVRAKGELELCPAVECVRERLGGQNDQFTRLGPHVRPLNLLIANG